MCCVVTFYVDDVLKHQALNGLVHARDLVLCKRVAENGMTYEIKKIADLDPAFPQDQVIVKAYDMTALLFKAIYEEELPVCLAHVAKADEEALRIFAKNVLQTEEHGVMEVIHPCLVTQTLPVLSDRLPEAHRYIITDPTKMEEMWSNSSRSHVPYDDWIDVQRQKWEASGTLQDFQPWVMCQEVEETAWEKNHPGRSLPKGKRTFTEDVRIAWHRENVCDPLLSLPPLMLPKWYWEAEYGAVAQAARENAAPRPPPFHDWMTEKITSRVKDLRNIAILSKGVIPWCPVTDAQVAWLSQTLFEHWCSGSSVEDIAYVTRKLLEVSGPITDASFVNYMERRECGFFLHAQQLAEYKNELDFWKQQSCDNPKEQESLLVKIAKIEKRIRDLVTEPVSEEVFLAWKEQQERPLFDRYEQSKVSMPFSEWRMQQTRNRYLPQEFVHLSLSESDAYRVTCTNGVLTRNGMQFTSIEESTIDRGHGWAIFMIKPDQELSSHLSLCCASQVEDIFDQRSFMRQEVRPSEQKMVVGAGELATDAQGTIISIVAMQKFFIFEHRGRSIVRPHEENIAILQWFQSQGVILRDVSFSYQTKGGHIFGPVNAQEYFDRHHSQNP